ncbi:hypothetical protein GCM10011344_15430 [Dokdonia pacifica]|uniref:Astacin (Peptidase family M12A) n=1 Tax=Dokdonia pacifica TaxID=1627892 RepID=A0A238W1J5_9FLAO|nr:M12 family metallopeptidase [Dokdonia pacifica]GGG15746.1 hypothetical protein GCM10011344_15430 [Dokdonia pacifica]SNR40368.1 Astacin (Peptidase family M12A) [Dokdonia pacifica]
MKKTLILALAFLAMLTACTQDDLTFEEPTSNSEAINSEISEDQSGEIITINNFKGEPIEFIKRSDNAYQVDDMVFTNEQFLQIQEMYSGNRSVAISNTSRRWPDFTVRYAIASNFNNPSRVYAAIQSIESQIDCINFIEINCTSPESVSWKDSNSKTPVIIGSNPCETQDYIKFISGSGSVSSSSVGRIGGKQFIQISNAASTGTVIHEIGHALGLFHEQQRSDRNNHLIYNPQNAQTGSGGNFVIPTNQVSVGPFDFNSIMLYSSYTFSNGNGPVLTKLDGSTYTVQRNAFTSGDVAILEDIHNDPTIPIANTSRTLIDYETSPDTQYFEHRYFVHFNLNQSPYTLPSSKVVHYSITTETSNIGGVPNNTQISVQYYTKALSPGQSTYTLHDVITTDKIFDFGQPSGLQYERWLDIEESCSEYYIQ